MHAWEKLVAESGRTSDDVRAELAAFRVETPSWGYANTGTRFGKFLQASAAVTLEHKFEDAGEVHRLTGIAPTVAVHVLWVFPEGFDSAVVEGARKHGLTIGAINPNVFQDQCYKFGSFTNPDAARFLHELQADPGHDLWSAGRGEQVAADMAAGEGLITAEDLAAYTVAEREPLR